MRGMTGSDVPFSEVTHLWQGEWIGRAERDSREQERMMGQIRVVAVGGGVGDRAGCGWKGVWVV